MYSFLPNAVNVNVLLLNGPVVPLCCAMLNSISLFIINTDASNATPTITTLSLRADMASDWGGQSGTDYPGPKVKGGPAKSLILKVGFYLDFFPSK